MNNTVNCLCDYVGIRINWDGYFVLDEIKCVYFYLTEGVRVITLDTPIVLKTGPNIPTFDTMVVPRVLILTLSEPLSLVVLKVFY